MLSSPPQCLRKWTCGQLSEYSACSVALPRRSLALGPLFYTAGGGTAQSPELIRLDKAPPWAELLLCTSPQSVESCRAKYLAALQSLPAPSPQHCCSQHRVPQRQACVWEEGRWAQLSSPQPGCASAFSCRETMNRKAGFHGIGFVQWKQQQCRKQSSKTPLN